MKARVVTHQQQGARIIRHQLFEQLQRLRVQIVGGFVHHQQVARFGEQPRQQQAVALAAGQHADGRVQAFRRKQKVAQIARHVPRLPVDGDRVAAAARDVVPLIEDSASN